MATSGCRDWTPTLDRYNTGPFEPADAEVLILRHGKLSRAKVNPNLDPMATEVDSYAPDAPVRVFLFAETSIMVQASGLVGWCLATALVARWVAGRQN